MIAGLSGRAAIELGRIDVPADGRALSQEPDRGWTRRELRGLTAPVGVAEGRLHELCPPGIELVES